ncbi:hypothetical protein E2C01_086734 [Portunus trituberculatus]|uniref:Uncharacterized protein n=1 Tax=Portunus trituberculatus TaxID=210409 RepID=A0A5B7J4L7_PORTR|nr:hypothetical protein [Portunus trituberculatus]
MIIEKKRSLVNTTQIEARSDPTPHEAMNDSAQEVSSPSSRPPEATHDTPLETTTQCSTTHEATLTFNEVVDSNSPNGVNLRELAKIINNIKTKLETKDLEIELLNTEVKAAYNTTENLQQRVTKLEGQR